MHRTIATSLTLLALSLAGCAGGGGVQRRDDAHDAGALVVEADGGWVDPGRHAPPRDGGFAASDDAAAPAMEVDAGPAIVPLPCGRTYDHQTELLARHGDPIFAELRHRDGTSLPADEGGTSCGGSTGCVEEVTRLCDGQSLTGVLENAVSFSVQGAQSGEAGIGSLVLTVCGEELAPMSYASTSTTLPGFVNGPQPAAPVSVRTCEVSVRAVGGCVWVRAVTVECSANQP